MTFRIVRCQVYESIVHLASALGSGCIAKAYGRAGGGIGSARGTGPSPAVFLALCKVIADVTVTDKWLFE